jgi:hypothetical protein
MFLGSFLFVERTQFLPSKNKVRFMARGKSSRTSSRVQAVTVTGGDAGGQPDTDKTFAEFFSGSFA